MLRRFLEILACPIDKHVPLQLTEFKVNDETIVDGVLICDKCNRFYPIIDEIPVMLPDDLRSEDDDIDFLTKWKDKLTKDILEGGKPVNLASPRHLH